MNHVRRSETPTNSSEPRPNRRRVNAGLVGAALAALGLGQFPDEIAAAVSFLVASPSITGQTLAIDGGQHMAWQTADVSAA